jgi:hypothetical protein
MMIPLDPKSSISDTILSESSLRGNLIDTILQRFGQSSDNADRPWALVQQHHVGKVGDYEAFPLSPYRAMG